MKRQSGFTLTEVMLVLVVGSILLGSSLALYNQLRTTSGHTNAWQKVLALQIMVEDQAVLNDGRYPTIQELRQVWKLKRTSDYASSPWGGPAVGGDASMTADGIRGSDLEPERYIDHPKNAGDSGILYYYRQNPASLDGFMSFTDLAKGGVETQVRFYMVGIADPQGERYHYVHGGHAGQGGQTTGGFGN